MGREANEHGTTHTEWLEWPETGLYLYRQERCPHATHVTMWPEKAGCLCFEDGMQGEGAEAGGCGSHCFQMESLTKDHLPRQITRLSSSPFLKYDFSSESKEPMVMDFLNTCIMNVPGLSDAILPFYYCINLWKLNPSWMSCSLCTLHTDIACPFHVRPSPQCIKMPVCITTDFLLMHVCGNGLDELPNWRFYLNEKGVCHFFCKQCMEIFHKWCIALPWISLNAAITLVTVSEIWKAIMEVCPAWAECLLLPLGHHTAQSKYLKLELGHAAMHT